MNFHALISSNYKFYFVRTLITMNVMKEKLLKLYGA